MNFTIYVLGDVSSFYATLNSVAMIFNSNSFMKGVYLVGGFVALISGSPTAHREAETAKAHRG